MCPFDSGVGDVGVRDYGLARGRGCVDDFDFAESGGARATGLGHWDASHFTVTTALDDADGDGGFGGC